MALHVADLRFEYGTSPLGLGVARPTLSWKSQTAAPDWVQESYEIAIESQGQRKTTGRVVSGESVFVPWPFEPLISRQQIAVQVRVWGAGSASPWSTPLRAEVALLNPDDWKARFIAAPEEPRPVAQPCPLLRTRFELAGRVAQARLYATALGVYELVLNGTVVGDQVLAPGWTSYQRRLKYQCFDVTDALKQGANVLGAEVADGWYRGRLGYNGGRRNIYGGKTALLAQLEVTYEDGTRQTIATDSSWQAHDGPTRSSEIYDGEHYDARLELPGWATPGFAPQGWSGVQVLTRDLSGLATSESPPVRRTGVLAAIAVTRSPSGKVLVDFGQNVVGRVRLRVRGEAGQRVQLRHAEVLEDGELGVRPLRTAQQTDSYVLGGRGSETWEPRFTFHGFRYVEVEGWPGGAPELGDLVAVVCHSDLVRTGWFSCSEPLLNRLHENIVWSVRGNFLDIPTDCPQRDERLGWTGDIQMFAPTACYLFDCAGFLRSWLTDLALEQREDGAVPNFVPNISLAPIVSSAAWGDAAVIVPWTLYQRFGDKAVLRAQFESVTLWLGYLEKTVGPSLLWTNGFQFGDWLDPTSPPGRPGDSRTDSALIATAYYARTAALASQIAGWLEKPAESQRFAALATRIREAFAQEFLSPTGRVVSDTVTAYAVALQFGLIPERARERAGARLAELVRDAGYRINTGFIGTPLVCDALCEAGYSRAAFLLLLQRENPSWLYPVTMGATTMWERWDSMLPSGKINPGDTTSFNHYALGAVADWIQRGVGGLAPLEPGYKSFLVKPVVGGGIVQAESTLETAYGLSRSRWELRGDTLMLEVTVPPNASARVEFPRSSAPGVTVGSGTHRWTYAVEPEPAPSLGLNSTLSELFAHGEQWRRLVEAIPYLACFETITQISSTTTLGQQLDFLPDGESYKPQVEEVFRRWTLGS